MTSSNDPYLLDVVAATAMSMSLPLYSTPPGQIHMISPMRDLQCQQWVNWSDQVAGPIYDEQEAFNIECPSQLEFGAESFKSSLSGTDATYVVSTWASQANDWSTIQDRNSAQSRSSLVDTYGGEAWSSANAQTQPDFHTRSQKSSNQTTTTNTGVNTKARTAFSARQQGPKSPKIGLRGRANTSGTNPPYGRIMTLEKKGRHKSNGEELVEQSNAWHPGSSKGHRVKNRAAAKRSREKTKQYEQYLVVKEHEMAQEKMYLDACLTALKNEALTLKDEVLRHGDCDCEMIQRYIVQAARSFGSGVAQTETEAHLSM
ncbi:hypothetical protein CMEL01_16761 [Colletotrichum melonis]|uniref:BZIP domain-containing protein n=1 Tax=Colletotrichum melonis TaxID=1209925 RepID=A0AAI9XKM0_9PEZI|nr:hypothetical protein CMEL01_16761 [Colletotrichum melonis]